MLDNALCERSVNLKEKYNVKESSDSNLFTTVSNFAIDLPVLIIFLLGLILIVGGLNYFSLFIIFHEFESMRIIQ